MSREAEGSTQRREVGQPRRDVARAVPRVVWDRCLQAVLHAEAGGLDQPSPLGEPVIHPRHVSDAVKVQRPALRPLKDPAVLAQELAVLQAGDEGPPRLLCLVLVWRPSRGERERGEPWFQPIWCALDSGREPSSQLPLLPQRAATALPPATAPNAQLLARVIDASEPERSRTLPRHVLRTCSYCAS